MRLISLFLIGVSLWAADAQRIVSTAPSITETLFAMGLGAKVVGDSIYCNYPPEAAKLPRIGTLLKPDIEAIVALHPDLVVVQKQPNDIAQQLTRVNIHWIEVDGKNLNDVYAAARMMGKEAGAGAAAEKLIGSMQSQMQNIRKLTATRPKVSAVFLVGHTPGRLEGLIAGAGKSFFSDLLDAAGGTNVFADSSAPYPKISLEEILARNPDVILELSGESIAKQEEVTALWQAHSTLKAVQHKRVYAIPPGPFLVPGPRAIEAARELLRLLHPELRL